MQSTGTRLARRFWGANRSYCEALLIFLTSRLVVALAILFSSRFVQRVPGAIFTDVTPRWYRYLLRWDAGWFLKIAREGYTYNGNDLIQQPVTFFPLYPVLAKVVATIFGVSEAAALLIVSNFALVTAALLFFKFVRDEYGDRVALCSLAALCFFPASIFLSAAYAESLTLLLVVTCFLLLKRSRFVLASVAVGLATATRFAGVVLCLPLVIEIWRRRREIKRAAPLGLVCVLLATSGLWLYMIYLWLAFKSPLAFLTARYAWQGGTSTGGNLFAILTGQPFLHLTDIWKLGPNPSSLAPWFFLAAICAIIFFRKRLSPSLFVYGLGTLLLSYLSFNDYMGFAPFTRYILPAFPAFIVAGEFLKERIWVGFAVIGLFASMLFMYTAFYAQFYWTG